MSQTKAEGPRKRRQFTEEFKQDAVRLVVHEQYSFAAAAKAVGVGEQSLRKWHARLAPKPPPCGDDASLGEFREPLTQRESSLQTRPPFEAKNCQVSLIIES